MCTTVQIYNVSVGRVQQLSECNTNTKTTDAPQTSARDNSTNIDPINTAIAAIEASQSGDKLSYRKAAQKFEVDYSTLYRRHRDGQGARDHVSPNSRLLNNVQEAGLVTYIGDLTRDGLPPTKAMVRNFASEIAGKRVGEGWVTRFIHRNKSHLIANWVRGLDRTRSIADNRHHYKLYFDLLHQKMKQYKIEPSNLYNMDEKGFAIGILSNSKRVFSRHY